MAASAASVHSIVRPEGGPPTLLRRGSGALAANLPGVEHEAHGGAVLLIDYGVFFN